MISVVVIELLIWVSLQASRLHKDATVIWAWWRRGFLQDSPHQSMPSMGYS